MPQLRGTNTRIRCFNRDWVCPKEGHSPIRRVQGGSEHVAHSVHRLPRHCYRLERGGDHESRQSTPLSPYSRGSLVQYDGALSQRGSNLENRSTTPPHPALPYEIRDMNS